MKIGLIDIDSHNFPNLVLMKISAWHKKQGDYVDFFVPLKQYDRVYVSKIFTFSADYRYAINAKEIISGGTGYDLKNKLPIEMENIYPDYDLYNVKEAYGFLTRGCPRGCPFCIVKEKEGSKSIKVNDLSAFWNNQNTVKLLDPNIWACPDWEELFIQLKNSKSNIDFTQGLDVRLIDDNRIQRLNELKIKRIHFAWDNYEFGTYDKLKYFIKNTRVKQDKLTVYVLTNFNTTKEQDLERIYKLRELGYKPYVMIFAKDKAPKEKRKLQRWCNNKFIFNVCKKFEDYKSEVLK